MKLLVTGGAGFIGSAFIRSVLKTRPSYEIFNVDKLTYAGNVANVKEIESCSRYFFSKTDICDFSALREIVSRSKAEVIVHFAAESHVDRSILNSKNFVDTNIVGTHLLLEIAREFKIKRFIHVSTDEVYGALGSEGSFTESSALAPNSPYAASKASSDLLVRSYFKTYGLPVIITRSTNNYGPYQYPEKMIPLFIIRAMQDCPLPVYGDGLYVRDWIHVEDHCAALLCALENANGGEIYNIGARCEKKNIDIALQILKILNKPHSLLHYVQDRPGHDRRYAIDPSKMERDLGWRAMRHLDDELPALIHWYQEHKLWWQGAEKKS